MTEEVVVAEEEVVAPTADETAEDDGFEAGFEGKPTEPAPPEEEPAEPEVEAEVVPEVKYRQVTEDEWTALQARAAEIDEIKATTRKDLDRAFGKVGGVERTLAALQAATPAGHTVDITDDMFSDLKEEFPELGDLVLKGMRNVAKGLKGTAQAAAPAMDPGEIDKMVTARFIKTQMEDLDEDIPDWRDTVGMINPDTGNPPETEYRKWLATQPAEYQTKLKATESPIVIRRSIAAFQKATTVAPDPKAEAAAAAVTKKAADAAARQARLDAAATPRGSGVAAPTAGEDPFDVGFRTG